MHALINGVRLHYETHGPTDAPALVFIHGFPLTGALWHAVIPHLKDEYRLIIPDLRGFGESVLSPHVQPGVSPPMSIAQYADDLNALLEHLGMAHPATVIGHSMGGYIALEFHRRYASRVQTLALVDTRAQPDAPEKIRERHATAERVLSEGSAVVANAMVDRLFAPLPAESETQAEARSLRERWREIMASASPESVTSALYAMAGRGGYVDELSRIFCPTLIVVGEHDAITPIADAQFMQRRLLASELTVIPGAGHMTPVEQPQAFADALKAFAREHVRHQVLAVA